MKARERAPGMRASTAAMRAFGVRAEIRRGLPRLVGLGGLHRGRARVAQDVHVRVELQEGLVRQILAQVLSDPRDRQLLQGRQRDGGRRGAVPARDTGRRFPD